MLNSLELKQKRRGVMLVVSSPSGAGKTTLCDLLLKRHQNLVMSVSMTTRPPRKGEVNGTDYFFVSTDEFEKMRAAGELLESALVFGNHYGTPRGPIEKLLAEGKDILFDIDWQGTSQLSATCREDLSTVFILPPSGLILEERLKGRGTESQEVIDRRMSQAAREISHWSEYDYVIINDDLETAANELSAILAAERQKRERLRFLPDFVQEILNELV